MRRARWPADGPFSLLVVLGLSFFAGLVALAGHHAAGLREVVACAVPAAKLLAYLSTLGFLLPAAIATVVTISASLALGHQLWATRRLLRRVLAVRLPLDDRARGLARRAGLAGRLDVVADEAVFAFCHGLRRPRVCISTGLADRLSDDELLAVLRHEAHHARYRDPVKILLSRTVAAGLGFLPLAAALHDSYLAGKEICADDEAERSSGSVALARALVRLLDARPPAWPAGVLAIGALTPTEARLQRLVAPEEATRTLPGPWDWIVTAALVAGIFGFSHGAASVAQAAPALAACDPVYATAHDHGPTPATLPIARTLEPAAAAAGR